MSSSSQKVSLSLWLIGAVVAAGMLCVGGCGDTLGKKSTSRQVQNIIDDLSRIEPEPEPNIPIPEVYNQPPKILEQIVGGAPEFKLFYFCRHLTAAELEAVINKMFATQLFNEKGKKTTIKDYGVSSVPATNQLIVRCPTREDVDAVLQTLQAVDVPPIQVKIYCIISEVYADRTLDWQTTLQIEELFGEDIWVGGAGQKFGTTVSQLLTEGDWLPAFPGASLRELARGRMGLKMGYWKTDRYLALVDLLESQGYLKILMNPILTTVNGKLAKVSQTQEVPLQQTYLKSPGAEWYETKIEYKPVTDSLEVTPHVFGDGYIGLETKILLGSKLTPEGVKQLPIITKKEIDNKENRIRPGESLVIGGIRKSEERDVIRGVPFLKDIPGLGILFSGKDFEERVVETIYILTPTISTGGVPREEIIEEVKRKHEPPEPKAKHGAITDPLGLKAKKREQQRKAELAEQTRLEAVAEKAEARGVVREAEAEAKRAKAEAETARAEADRVKTEAEKATTDAAKTKAEAEKLAAEAQKTKADAKKAIAEAEAKANAAEKARAEAEAEKAKARAAKAEAEEPKEETEQAKAEEKPEEGSGEAKAEAEKPKGEAEKAEAEKPKGEAEKAKAEKPKGEAEKAEAEKPKEDTEAKAEEDKAGAEGKKA